METLQQVLEQLEALENSENFDLDEYKTLLEKAEQLRQQEQLKQKAEELKNWAAQPKPTVTPAVWGDGKPQEFAVDEKSWVEVDGVKYLIPVGVQSKSYKSAFEGYLAKGKEHLGPEDRKTLQSGVDGAGGYLVPEDFMTQLLKKVAAMSTFRSKARVYTTSRDAVSIPYIKYTTDDIYTSGIRMNWLGELPASASDHRFTSTDVFDIKKIEVHNAYSSVPISEDMLMDSAFNITSVLTELFAESFALGEEEAFTAGNGVRRPRGLITETADITQVVSGNASALTADGILDLYFALPRQYRASAVWVMNSATQKAIEKFKDTQGRYLISSLLNSSLSLGETESLKGKPIMVNEFMPDIAANAFPLIFGDLSGYAIVDRMGISIQRLSEIYAEYNTVLFLCRKRVGGMLVEPWKFRVQKVAAS